MAFTINLNETAEKIAKSIYDDDEDLMAVLSKHCIIGGKLNRELMLIVIDEYAKLRTELTLDQIRKYKQEVKDTYPE